MTKDASRHGADLPEWVRILPLGTVELVDRREPLEVDAASLNMVAKAFRHRGVDVVVDYEHQSLQGGRAPAAGWIKEIQAREDGLWGRVEWTDQAQEYLRRREYRYFSPVLKLDPETRRPQALMQVALTNVPAIKGLDPLVARYGGASRVKVKGLSLDDGSEEGLMQEKLKVLVGLEAQAPEEALWSKALQVLRDLGTALGLGEEASGSQLKGAAIALKAEVNRMQEIQTELAALKARVAQEDAVRAVEEALRAGKVSPAQKEWALEYFRQDPEGFKTFAARAPQAVPLGQLPGPGDDRGLQGRLDPEEVAICRALNLAPEDYLKAKAQVAK
jgi:phage I-like protein